MTFSKGSISSGQSIKDIFSNFYIFRKYFERLDKLFILKNNEFYNENELEDFRVSIILLSTLGFIKPLPNEEIAIYLYKNNEMQPKEYFSKKFVLTPKGLDMLEILPEET